MNKSSEAIDLLTLITNCRIDESNKYGRMLICVDLHSKEPDSGSSSTTTLSIENEVKRNLLPQLEVDNTTKRHQGAIPNRAVQNPPRRTPRTTVSFRVSSSRERILSVTSKCDGREPGNEIQESSSRQAVRTTN